MFTDHMSANRTESGTPASPKSSHKNISSALRWGKCFFLLFLISLSGSFQACQDPEEIGLNLLPEGDRLNLVFSDTTEVRTRTIPEDSLRTDEVSAQLLGSMSDPVFGKHQAAIYTQVVLQGTPSFGTVTQADSLVLSLAYSGFYGDSTTAQTVNVYRLTEDMYFDSAYYSNRTFGFDPTPIGTATFLPAPKTPVTVGSDTNALPQVRIRLSQNLADSLMLLNGQTQYASNDNWKAYFKGLHLAVDPITTAGKGGISSFNFLNSKMNLYFHDTANTVQNYAFSLSAARSTHFSHDYSGSDVGLQLADSTALDSLTFLQAMGGVKTKLNLPFLKHFTDSGSILVNKAELELTIQSGNSGLYPAPNQLLLLAVNENGEGTLPTDYLESASYFGGTINSDGVTYKFNIARHVQSILNGSTTDYGYYLVITGSSVQANRLILQSGKDRRMKLNLYYTKLPN